MPDSTHSPTPWRVEPSPTCDGFYAVVDANGNDITFVTLLNSKANAEHIVACVNAVHRLMADIKTEAPAS